MATKKVPQRRNKKAGKSTGKSRSAKYFAKNKKARDKKKAYEMEKALRAWLKEVKDPNDLINAFTDAGIFLDPKDLKMMMADGMSANDFTFYNILKYFL